ncbi:MAG TPA: L-threonylcarbamoyladenylate synthase [Candidatus Nanopelagicaceae bacterium]|nr:L-threonylcarbamoyladenylate synthase [Candidatus Nanopelagicaceae bacterium]
MAMIISQCSLSVLRQSAEKLRAGDLVAFPTETVYGIGADAMNKDAVARMYQVKNRPASHPVIVHIAELNDVDYWAQEIPEYAINLMRDFWPGPMTLLLKRREVAGDFLTGAQEIVGLRIPANSLALGLLNEFKAVGGKGIAAPSANRYGAVSPTTAEAVSQELSEFLSPSDQILDGGPCLVGVESTIIDCSGQNPKILRPGAISAEMIEESTGIVLEEVGETKIRVSGSDKQHYAPKAKVIVDGQSQRGEGLIAMSDVATPEGVIRLAEPKSVEEYARVLYSALRMSDTQNLQTVRIIPPVGPGLAVAIRDRINRAAAN